MKIKTFFIFFLAIFVLSSSVYAVNVTDAHGVSMSSSIQSANNRIGVIIQPKVNLTVWNITFYQGGCTATDWEIFDMNGTAIKSGTINQTGDNADNINFNLSNTSLYRIAVSRTSGYDCGQTGVGQINLSKTNLYYVNGTYRIGSTWSNATQYFGIVSITTEEIPSESPSNVTDFTFINQTPSDITNTNLFTSTNLSIFYNISKPNPTNIYLNYTTNTTQGWIEKINGSVVVSGYRQTNYSSFSDNITGFSLFPDNGVYPSVSIGYNQSVYSSTVHNSTLLVSPNDYILTKIYNMTNQTLQNYIEFMLNTTLGTCRVIYCNSSYFFGNPLTSPNCFHFATLTNTPLFNHNHGNLSQHNLFNFPINGTGFTGNGVRVSENGNFLINAQSGTCQIQYISNTTRSDTTQISLNNGAIWTDQNYTLDGHLHQFNSNDTFNYQACATNSTNTTCSDVRTDNLDITPFPPIIELDNPDTEGQVVSSRFLNISWSYILTGATNINFSVFLTNSSSPFDVIKSISIGQGNTTYYNWNIPLSEIPIYDDYHIYVLGTDNIGQSSFDLGESFNLTKNAVINVSAKEYFNNATINTFNLSVLDLNTSEVILYNTTTGTIDVNTIINHTYQIIADGADYSYKIINITQSNFTQNYTFYMNKTNSIYIQIFDANTLQPINTSTTSITFLNSNSTQTVTTTNGTYLAVNLTPDIYTITINNSAYSLTSFIVTLDFDTDQSLNAYLIGLNNTQFMGFFIQDLSTEPVNATINVQKLINSSFATIGNKQTDILGFTYFYLEQGVTYKFTITASGFRTKTFDLQPFLVNQPYIIRLDSSTSTPFVSIFDEVQYTLIPTNLNISTGNNIFQIHTNSPNGKILFTWINCTGAISPTNSTGFPNGAVASVQVLGVTEGQTITCQYIISADGFEPASFYKYYHAGIQPNINQSTNLKSQMDSFFTTYNKGWTTILAMLIIIGLASTLGFLTGNPIVVTFTVFVGIGFFAVFGWISKTIAFMTIAIVLLTYYMSSRVSG